MENFAEDIVTAAAEVEKLKSRADEVRKRKAKIENELQGINYRFKAKKTRFDTDEYRGLIKRQMQLKVMLNDVITEIDPIKAEIRKWAMLETEARARMYKDQPQITVSVDQGIKDKVIAIRNKYLEFSEDGTRISSMRLMASEIANDLTKLIHSA